MDLRSLITSSLTGAAVDALAKHTGVNRAVVQSVADAAVPLMVGGIAKNTQTSNGADNLDKTVAKNHSGSILSDLPNNILQAGAAAEGAKILGHVFGGSTGNVAKTVGSSTGAKTDDVMNVMNVLAPVVMGAIGHASKTSRQSPSTVVQQR